MSLSTTVGSVDQEIGAFPKIWCFRKPRSCGIQCKWWQTKNSLNASGWGSLSIAFLEISQE